MHEELSILLSQFLRNSYTDQSIYKGSQYMQGSIRGDCENVVMRLVERMPEHLLGEVSVVELTGALEGRALPLQIPPNALREEERTVYDDTEDFVARIHHVTEDGKTLPQQTPPHASSIRRPVVATENFELWDHHIFVTYNGKVYDPFLNREANQEHAYEGIPVTEYIHVLDPHLKVSFDPFRGYQGHPLTREELLHVNVYEASSYLRRDGQGKEMNFKEFASRRGLHS